ncbi:MAG TPA: ribonuclease P protein component [Alphaproteobacteria bacterium]
MRLVIERLKSRDDFLRVASGRHKYATPGLVLQMRQREDISAAGPTAGPARVGFTATRKLGSAVVRNRARRRLREAARAVLPVAGRPGCDYVLIARSGTLTRPYLALLADLETAVAALAPRNAPEHKAS